MLLKRILSVLVLGALGACLCGCVRRTETGQIDVWNPNGISDFELLDQQGKTVRKADLAGRPWLACFIFTRCPYSCPRLTVEMEKLNQEFVGGDLQFVSFSVDPKHDTPPVLAAYAKKVNADPERWKFLTTTSREALFRLTHQDFKVAFADDAPAELEQDRIIHSNLILYVDPQGRVQGKFDGLKDKDLAALRRFLKTPPTIRHFPIANASLNGLACVLLILGWVQIKLRWAKAHKRTMLAAFAVSIVFLGCYLTYHAFAGSKPYDPGPLPPPVEASGAASATPVVPPTPEELRNARLRDVYFTLLLSHIGLAALVPVLAVVTIVVGLRAERSGNWPLHRRWAWVTFPIWLYVSVTGVVIYLMLYRPEMLGLGP